MNRIKGVVVGAGYFSQFHLDAWNRMEHVELAAICDTDLSKAANSAAAFQVPRSYADFGEMLKQERPAFVDIITRPDSHLALTREAVQSGAAVICQKPLAPTTAEAADLVAIAEAADVPLMVHENFRFQPWYREIKGLLNRQEIGPELHAISVRTRLGDGWQEDAYLGRQPYFRTMDRFLVFELGVHFIDTFRYLAGEIQGVYATLHQRNAAIAGEDAGTVLFEFDSGAQGIWDASRFHESNSQDPRYTFGEVLLEANEGSIRLALDGTLTVQRLGEAEREHVYEHASRNFASDCVLQTQQHFIHGLQTGSGFETSGSEYLKTLRVQDAIYDSARRGIPVRGLHSEGEVDANH